MKKKETPSDHCRICCCLFKVQLGNSSISSENLFKPSQRKGLYGTILANIRRLVGVEVVENSKLYSDRVHNPCARKIRNLGSLFELTNTVIEKESMCTLHGTTPPKQGTNLYKRLLDTPPGKSPSRKTVRVNSPVSAIRASRKSLRLELQENPAWTLTICQDVIFKWKLLWPIHREMLPSEFPAMMKPKGWYDRCCIIVPCDDKTKKLIWQIDHRICG